MELLGIFPRHLPVCAALFGALLIGCPPNGIASVMVSMMTLRAHDIGGSYVLAGN